MHYVFHKSLTFQLMLLKGSKYKIVYLTNCIVKYEFMQNHSWHKAQAIIKLDVCYQHWYFTVQHWRDTGNQASWLKEPQDCVILFIASSSFFPLFFFFFLRVIDISNQNLNLVLNPDLNHINLSFQSTDFYFKEVMFLVTDYFVMLLL